MSETTDRSLLLRGITKSYETGAGGSKTVLEGIDLHIGPGELVVLLGANGSGKSTTLKIASGMIAPTAGKSGSAGPISPKCVEKPDDSPA